MVGKSLKSVGEQQPRAVFVACLALFWVLFFLEHCSHIAVFFRILQMTENPVLLRSGMTFCRAAAMNVTVPAIVWMLLLLCVVSGD